MIVQLTLDWKGVRDMFWTLLIYEFKVLPNDCEPNDRGLRARLDCFESTIRLRLYL